MQETFGCVPDEAVVMIAEALNLSRAEPMGGTTADERVTLEPIYCLGLCHSSPAAMLDGRGFGMLDESKLETLLKEAQT